MCWLLMLPDLNLRGILYCLLEREEICLVEQVLINLNCHNWYSNVSNRKLEI
jgi:hypothetical protein